MLFLSPIFNLSLSLSLLLYNLYLEISSALWKSTLIFVSPKKGRRILNILIRFYYLLYWIWIITITIMYAWHSITRVVLFSQQTIKRLTTTYATRGVISKDTMTSFSKKRHIPCWVLNCTVINFHLFCPLCDLFP